MLRFNCKSTKIFLTIIIYRVLLDIIYLTWIQPRYNFRQFSISYSTIVFIAVNFTFILFTKVISKHYDSKPLVYKLLYLMYFVPTCVMCSYSSGKINYFIYVTIYFIEILLLIQRLRISNKFFKFKIIQLENNGFGIIILIMSVIIIAISGIYTRFNISFDISEYYELRAMAKSLQMPSLLNYLYNWGVNLMPIALAIAIIEKNIPMGFLCTITQMFAFSFNGKKSVLFMFLLVWAICFLYKENNKDKVSFFFSAFSLVCLGELIIRKGESILTTLFIRRMIFVPAYLGGAYYDFFQDNEFDYLRSSFLRHFGFLTPYTQAIPETIGNYIGHIGEHSNTGLCGDAYSNFGWYSLLFYPLLDAIVIVFVNKCMSNIDCRITLVASFLLTYTMVSGSFFSILLNNGVFFICIMLAMYTNKMNKSKLLLINLIKRKDGIYKKK